MNDLVKSLEDLCAERGMRMTEQRRVIARILDGAEDHPDVEELLPPLRQGRCQDLDLDCLPHRQAV